MAGESAAEVARRMREKAERQRRAAQHWEKGAEGERVTAEALTALPAATWTTFHDVSWPGRPLANIDHVVVGPGGVFMIDSKNWSGRIEVRQDMLHQDGRRREPAVTGAAEAALALTPVVAGVTGRAVVPVLCFLGTERVGGWARDVMVCSTTDVAQMLASRPAVLTPEQVQEAVRALEASLRGAGPGPQPVSRLRIVTPETPETPAAPPARRAPAPTRRSTGGATSRRRRRGGASVPAIVGLILAAVLLVPSVREGATVLIADFIVSTAVDGQAPSTTAEEAERTPAQQRRQQQRERRRQERRAGTASEAPVPVGDVRG